jgi:hypothetical protein
MATYRKAARARSNPGVSGVAQTVWSSRDEPTRDTRSALVEAAASVAAAPSRAAQAGYEVLPAGGLGGATRGPRCDGSFSWRRRVRARRRARLSAPRDASDQEPDHLRRTARRARPAGPNRCYCLGDGEERSISGNGCRRPAVWFGVPGALKLMELLHTSAHGRHPGRPANQPAITSPKRASTASRLRPTLRAIPEEGPGARPLDRFPLRRRAYFLTEEGEREARARSRENPDYARTCA